MHAGSLERIIIVDHKRGHNLKHMGGTTPEGGSKTGGVGGDRNGVGGNCNDERNNDNNNENNNNNNDSNNNDTINENENSPESAGLARGLARSAAPRGAGNVAVGRLPLRSSGPSTVTSVGAVSNVTTTATTASSRMTRIQRVAKVSDRASTGFDFVEAHQEAATTTTTTTTETTTTNMNANDKKNNSNSNSNTNGSQPPSVKKDSWRIRVSSFAGSLAKNTVLGAAVFATYEEMIDRFEDLAEKKHQQNQRVASSPSDWIRIGGNDYSNGNGYDEKDAFSSPPRTQLSQHYAAGFCAGCVHACLGRLFEGVSLSLSSPPPPLNLVSNVVGSSSPNVNVSLFRAAGSAAFAFLPNVLHHATSHAVLFGSYESVKRVATPMVTVLRTSLAATNAKMHENNNNDESGGGGYLDDDLVAVALAGGIAGIGQQVVGDVAEQLAKALRRQEHGAAKRTPQTPTPTMPPSPSMSPPTTMSVSMTTMRWWLATIKAPRYSARSLGMMSVPTAIGFVAFEYGREAVTAN